MIAWSQQVRPTQLKYLHWETWKWLKVMFVVEHGVWVTKV